jgi:hypothetical protein
LLEYTNFKINTKQSIKEFLTIINSIMEIIDSNLKTQENSSLKITIENNAEPKYPRYWVYTDTNFVTPETNEDYAKALGFLCMSDKYGDEFIDRVSLHIYVHSKTHELKKYQNTYAEVCPLDYDNNTIHDKYKTHGEYLCKLWNELLKNFDIQFTYKVTITYSPNTLLQIIDKEPNKISNDKDIQDEILYKIDNLIYFVFPNQKDDYYDELLSEWEDVINNIQDYNIKHVTYHFKKYLKIIIDNKHLIKKKIF